MKPDDTTSIWKLFFTSSDKLRNLGARGYEQQFVNMTFNQLRMIKVVYLLNREFPEGVTLKVLAESLSITPAAASEMVDALVRKDMLRREHNPQDRRAVAITLAASSRKCFQECETVFEHYSAEFLKQLSGEDRDTAMRLLRQFDDYVTALGGKNR